MGHVTTHHFLLIVTKIVTCDNTNTMESKDELVLVVFFFHPIFFVICN